MSRTHSAGPEVTTAISVTTARQDLYRLVDQVDDDQEAVDEVDRGETVERELQGLQDATEPSQTDVDAVRAWARENGFEVLPRGEVPGAARTSTGDATPARDMRR